MLLHNNIYKRLNMQGDSYSIHFSNIGARWKILIGPGCLMVCRSRQASIVLERYFRFEISLLSILCMLIVRMKMGTSRVSGDSDIIR